MQVNTKHKATFYSENLTGTKEKQPTIRAKLRRGTSNKSTILQVNDTTVFINTPLANLLKLYYL